MQPEDFKSFYNVSDDVYGRLVVYHKLLLKWQGAINLVSPKTVQESWSRHFADSAQVIKRLPEVGDAQKTLVDLGSGAGFPGLVVGIMRPDFDTHLIESDERKAQFLRTVSRETQANVTVHNERIERVEGLEPGFVSARALSDLSGLLGHCAGWSEFNADLKMLFLKGRSYEEELAEARTLYDFECEEFVSETSSESRLLFISNLIAR